VQPATFFFRQLSYLYNKDFTKVIGAEGAGYESTIALRKNGKPVYENQFTNVVRIYEPSEGANTYRAKKDFILPKMGMYAWIINGTLGKKGKPPVTFDAKWTCQAPRIPLGPYDLNDIEGTVIGGPEFWFDCARYTAKGGAAAAASSTAQASPRMKVFLERKGWKLQ
jgi:hypothetical protein